MQDEFGPNAVTRLGAARPRFWLLAAAAFAADDGHSAVGKKDVPAFVFCVSPFHSRIGLWSLKISKVFYHQRHLSKKKSLETNKEKLLPKKKSQKNEYKQTKNG